MIYMSLQNHEIQPTFPVAVHKHRLDSYFWRQMHLCNTHFSVVAEKNMEERNIPDISCHKHKVSAPAAYK